MAFENLKFIDAVNRSPADAAAKRRQRLVTQINKQVGLAKEFMQGRVKRARWFQHNQDGSFSLAIRYGRRDLELAKGKFGVSCGSIDEVIDALSTVRLHCSQGQFDTQLEKLSREIRKGFVKKAVPGSVRNSG